MLATEDHMECQDRALNNDRLLEQRGFHWELLLPTVYEGELGFEEPRRATWQTRTEGIRSQRVRCQSWRTDAFRVYNLYKWGAPREIRRT